MRTWLVLEAQDSGLLLGGNPAKALKRHPSVICGLSRYLADIRMMLALLKRVEPLTPEVIIRSMEVRQKHGLLTNDSLTIAMMELFNSTGLATADQDFLRLPSLDVFLPSDLRR